MIDIFAEQLREIMYFKWDTALLADLIWTCGQHVLFHNIFVCFITLCVCVCTNHKNLNFLLID